MRGLVSGNGLGVVAVVDFNWGWWLRLGDFKLGCGLWSIDFDLGQWLWLISIGGGGWILEVVLFSGSDLYFRYVSGGFILFFFRFPE